jgi:hypothetical protein
VNNPKKKNFFLWVNGGWFVKWTEIVLWESSGAILAQDCMVSSFRHYLWPPLYVTCKLICFYVWGVWGLQDGVHWKRRWEGQLSGLQYRDTTRGADIESWGARMRRKMQEQAS